MAELNSASPQTSSRGGFAALYSCFAQFLSKLQSPFLLLIRVYIGYQCAISGLAHLHNYDATVRQFQEWKIPHAHAAVGISAVTEVVGGGLLLIGFAARLISIPLVVNFLVAMIQTDLAYPKSTEQLKHLWDNQDIILKDTAFPFFATALIILIFGPGWFSIDGIIKCIRNKK